MVFNNTRFGFTDTRSIRNVVSSLLGYTSNSSVMIPPTEVTGLDLTNLCYSLVQTGNATAATNITGMFPVYLGDLLTFSFDGATQYLTIVDSDNLSYGSSNNDSAFAIGAIIRSHDFTNYMAIVSKVNSAFNAGEYSFGQTNTGKLHLDLLDQSTGGYLSATTVAAITQDTWYVVWATYDGSSSATGIKIYINGIQQTVTTGSASYTSMENTNVDVRIGCTSDLAQKWNGAMACWNIVGASLTPQQVQALSQMMMALAGL